jgi:PHD/YefM family antitoxin component YafN of YafNO toxin-antitoxin module
MNADSTYPEIVVRDGKPVAVILGIDEYQEMLEKIEDLEGLKVLERLRQEPLELRPLDDFLKEYSPDVSLS